MSVRLSLPTEAQKSDRSCTHLSAKLGNRLYGAMLAEARRPLEGSVMTLVGVEEVDDVTGVAPAAEGRDGDPGADALWTGFVLAPVTQPFRREFGCPVRVHSYEPTAC
jgi:hypothetical protein